jgi:hypothetical protein
MVHLKFCATIRVRNLVKKKINKFHPITSHVGAAVGTATRYGLDGPEIESRWGRDFPHPFRPALGPTQLPIQWVTGLSRGYSSRGVALTTHPI